MSNQNDPRGEYTRVCPYCGDSFIADHLSRYYCPEKKGKKNQCKNRQKRVMDKVRKSGGIIPVHKKNPLEVSFKDKVLPSNDIDKISKDAQINSNIRVLEKIIGDKSYVELTEIELLEKGFDKEFFDSYEDTLSKIRRFYIGIYVFHKMPNNNNIYITLKQNYHGTK